MDWLDTALRWIAAALLPLAAVLLLEELTFGGLVRLLLARRPETGKQVSPRSEAKAWFRCNRNRGGK